MHRSSFPWTQLAVVITLLTSAVSHADEILLNNGGKLVGKLISAQTGTIIFDVEFVGEVNVDTDGIKSIVTDTPVTVLRKNGDVLENKILFFKDDKMLLVSEDDSVAPVRYHLDNVEIINPEPWQIGDGYKWFGTISAAMLIERGNTNSDEFDINLRSIWRSLEDRYTFLGESERDKSNDELQKDNTKLTFKYDYFLDDVDDYVGGLISVEDDTFADLKQRTIIGPYIGRQFYETDTLMLQGELGLVYVKEEFIEAPTNEYPGVSWAAYATSDYLGGNTTLYLDHDGLIDTTNKSDLILNTTLGIGAPLYGGLEGAAEIKFEYDGGAVDGVNKTDETYNLRLGYSW